MQASVISLTSPMRPNGMRDFLDSMTSSDKTARGIGVSVITGDTVLTRIFSAQIRLRESAPVQDTAFGGGVVGDLGSAGARCHRRKDHNSAKFLRTHETERGATAEKVTGQVDLYCAVPILESQLQERYWAIDPRAAGQIIDVAGSLTDGVECCVDRRF